MNNPTHPMWPPFAQSYDGRTCSSAMRRARGTDEGDDSVSVTDDEPSPIDGCPVVALNADRIVRHGEEVMPGVWEPPRALICSLCHAELSLHPTVADPEVILHIGGVQ